MVVTKPGDEVVLATAHGMAIRFKQSDARPMGRNASGVKGIKLVAGDHGGGHGRGRSRGHAVDRLRPRLRQAHPLRPEPGSRASTRNCPITTNDDEDDAEVGDRRPAEPEEHEEGEEGEDLSSQRSYRTQRRGGKGLRDIKTTDRNGPVVGIVRVSDEDEL